MIAFDGKFDFSIPLTTEHVQFEIFRTSGPGADGPVSKIKV